MAGHSKWSNIQHRKGAQDKKRSKIFTKIVRELTVAARMGEPNPDFNPRLRLAVDKALAANMNKDKIEHAIKKGSGEIQDIHYEYICYEAHGPAGVAMIIDCLTDNKNRTVSEVRHVLSRKGGHLGTSGSSAYLFHKKGYLIAKMTEDEVIEASMDFEVEDIQASKDQVMIITPADETLTKLKALISKKHDILFCDFDTRPDTYLELNDSQKNLIVDLVDQLEDLDDVQKVYTNVDLNE